MEFPATDEPLSVIELDLIQLPVADVTLNDQPVSWDYDDAVLSVQPDTPLAVGDSATLEVVYAGGALPLVSGNPFAGGVAPIEAALGAKGIRLV